MLVSFEIRRKLSVEAYITSYRTLLRMRLDSGELVLSFVEEIEVILGGPQGGGIETAAQIFIRVLGEMGFYVYGKREYYSNITGRHSYFQVRARSTPVRSVRSKADIVAGMDAESIATHFDDVIEGGALVYDPSFEGIRIDSLPMMEESIRDRISKNLEENGYQATVGGAIRYAAERYRVRLYPVPYQEILKRAAEELGASSLAIVQRFLNTVVLGSVAALINIPLEVFKKALESYFGLRRPQVIQQNELVAKKVYEYFEKNLPRFDKILRKPINGRDKMVLVNGNEAIAIGKILGGLTFQSYYPITPAADESFFLEGYELIEVDPDLREEAKLLQGAGIVVFQTEDELAAINMAIGAALAGARAATATSGPGFSLMVEGLGFAGMNEVPVVVTYYMRGGPSTGLPTRDSQSDLLFSLFAGHGEFPRIVIASGDHEELVYDAVRALNWAEKYQLPVIHLVDKNLANSWSLIRVPKSAEINIDRGKIVDKGGWEYKRFVLAEDGISPRAFIGSPETVMWYTGDEHNAKGHITEDPELRYKMYLKRMKKLETADREIPESERAVLYGREGSDVLIVSWGSVKGAVLDAIEVLNREGFDVSFLQIKVFSPLPREYVKRILTSSKIVIGIENNYLGQAARFIKMETGYEIPHLALKWTGRPVTETEVINAVKSFIKTGERVIHLRDGK
ncbi:MAG: 2-oxoacid:ferredoxin oxidoreductase subunit alpha [Sulfolobales archaeon]